jgi:hypothetical protein
LGIIGKQIEKYLILKKMPVSNFEAKIGISNGNIRKCIKQGTDIQSKWVTNIISTFEDINPICLLTGKGDILLDRPEPSMLGEAALRYLYDKTKKLDDLQLVLDNISKKMEGSTDSNMPLLSNEIVQIFNKLATDYTRQKSELVKMVDHHKKLEKVIQEHLHLK